MTPALSAAALLRLQGDGRCASTGAPAATAVVARARQGGDLFRVLPWGVTSGKRLR